MDTPNDLQVNVIAWPDGSRHIALFLPDFDQMVTFNADTARNLAFLLMECADFLQPPFDSNTDMNDDSTSESESIFGPYEEDENQEDDEEDDEDED